MAAIENYLLGMDCGTTNIKAIILGEDGSVVAEASRPSRFLSPGPNTVSYTHLDGYKRQVECAGVRVLLNTEVTPDFIAVILRQLCV